MKLFGLLAIILSLTRHAVKSQRIQFVGNPLVESSTSINWAQTSFVLQDARFTTRAIVFAFSFYVSDMKPIKLQVLRPVNEDNLTYTLVNEWDYSVTIMRGLEIFYINTQQGAECAIVEENDVLGVYVPDTSSAISASFSSGENMYRYQFSNEPAPSVGDTIQYDSIRYPYKLSVKAYVDTDMSRYTSGVTCPSLTITETVLPPVGQDSVAGATGATGSMGSTGNTGPRGGTGPRGPQGVAGNLGPPGVMGPQGEMGLNGSTGATGEEGPAGPIGPQGDAGPKGDKGVPGEMGPPGPPGPRGRDANGTIQTPSPLMQVRDCSWCVEIMDPYLMLGTLVWLGAVTLCVLVLAVCTCCCKRSRESHYSQANGARAAGKGRWSDYDNPAMGKDDPTYVSIEEGKTVF